MNPYEMGGFGLKQSLLLAIYSAGTLVISASTALMAALFVFNFTSFMSRFNFDPAFILATLISIFAELFLPLLQSLDASTLLD